MDKLLTPDFGLMFWTLVNFILLVLLLGKFAWKPVLEAIDRRDAKIKSDREAAEAARSEAEKIRTELNARMTKLGEETRALLAQAQAAAQKERETMLSEAKRQAEDTLRQAKTEIAAEQQRAIADIKKEIAGISLMAAEKVVGKAMNRDANEEIVASLLNNLKGKNGN